MSEIKQRCERIWATKRDMGSGTTMVYQRPAKKTDLKREGRTLTIVKSGRKMVLDGVQLRSLKCILRDVGEIKVPRRPCAINRRKCKVQVVPVEV